MKLFSDVTGSQWIVTGYHHNLRAQTGLSIAALTTRCQYQHIGMYCMMLSSNPCYFRVTTLFQKMIFHDYSMTKK